MARVNVYADESGNFNFSRDQGASRFFILTSVTLLSHDIAQDLQDLRRQLVWDGHDISGPFHATEERQAVRDEVFRTLDKHEFRIDCTVLDKPKCLPRLRRTDESFYKTAWFYHLKHVTPRIITDSDELFLVAASLGTKKKRNLFHEAVKNVVYQVAATSPYRTASWPAAIEPCLQVADYCSWALQKKWEHGDLRSYDLIKDKIQTEFDLFETGDQLYY